MPGSNEKYIDESIATATVGVNILKARQVFQKGAPLYALVHVSGTWTGSLTVECSPPDKGLWAPCATAITANGATSLLIPADADYRFNLGTLGSGGPVAAFMALPA